MVSLEGTVFTKETNAISKRSLEAALGLSQLEDGT